MSPRIHLPPKLDREGIEHYQQHVEGVLNTLTTEAEDWATAGDHREGEYCSGPRALPLLTRRRRRAELTPPPAEEQPAPPSPALPRKAA